MDLFRRKRIRELEQENAELRRRLEACDAMGAKATRNETALVRDLREMDQLVFQMSQAGSADQLRSAVQRAWAITEPRMRRESDRIAAVMIPEIKKAYLK